MSKGSFLLNLASSFLAIRNLAGLSFSMTLKYRGRLVRTFLSVRTLFASGRVNLHMVLSK